MDAVIDAKWCNQDQDQEPRSGVAGPRGLRTVHFRSSVWNSEFVATSADDGRSLRCVASVADVDVASANVTLVVRCNAQFTTPPRWTRQNTPVCVVSCLAWRCGVALRDQLILEYTHLVLLQCVCVAQRDYTLRSGVCQSIMYCLYFDTDHVSGTVLQSVVSVRP